MFDNSQSTITDSNSVLSQMGGMNHEQVLFCQDSKTGLKAIIAIHNTVLGPSLGGTRMWNYATEAEALRDVLRLSRGMTYKSAISGLNLGGGKAVIIGDSRTAKNEALMRSFGKFVNSLGGKYITAEDVGISTKDIEYVSMETKHVAGLPESMGGGGDPSPVTAYGVYMGIKAGAKKKWGSDSLSGKKILVQGVGHVGYYLVELLNKENAKITVSDIHADSIAKVVDEFGCEVVSVDDAYDISMDIYAPCALGATINDDTLKRLKCEVIAGSANNQLLDESKHGQELLNKNILYAPDFLINAGGIINCYSEVIGYNRDAAYQKTEGIYKTTLDIFEKAEKENIPTQTAAQLLAEARIEAIGNIKLSF